MNGQADNVDRRRWTGAALGAALLLASAGAARADVWTNAAGHAIEAALISADGNAATFKRGDGTRFTMALASLSPASRRQVQEEIGRVLVPERLQTDFNLCVHTLKRLDVLRQEGEISGDSYTARRDAALARLKHAFERWDVPESERPRLLLLARNT